MASGKDYLTGLFNTMYDELPKRINIEFMDCQISMYFIISNI